MDMRKIRSAVTLLNSRADSEGASQEEIKHSMTQIHTSLPYTTLPPRNLAIPVIGGNIKRIFGTIYFTLPVEW